MTYPSDMTRRSSTPTPNRGHAGAVGTKTPDVETHPSLTVPTAPEILERVAVLKAEHPDGNYPSPWPEHGEGECVECDALRLLHEDA